MGSKLHWPVRPIQPIFLLLQCASSFSLGVAVLTCCYILGSVLPSPPHRTQPDRSLSSLENSKSVAAPQPSRNPDGRTEDEIESLSERASERESEEPRTEPRTERPPQSLMWLFSLPPCSFIQGSVKQRAAGCENYEP